MAVFSADESFVNFLINIGYQQKEVKSEKKYFVNKNGSQIRIGRNEIALIDKGGYLISKRKTVDSKDIEAFSNREYHGQKKDLLNKNVD